MKKRIGTLATYPDRKDSFLEMLNSVTIQLDVLYVYANGYTSGLSDLVKKMAEVSNHCKIKIIDEDFGAGNIKDMGKFWPLSEDIRGTIYLLDDDIVYPTDYCLKHELNIRKYQCISTVHGRNLKCFPVNNYFGNTNSIHWRRSLQHPVPVHICGTGTVAFSTDYFRPRMANDEVLKKYIGMADIWFSCMANQMGMKIMAIQRYENWLQHTQASGGTTSLYVQTKNNTSKHCDCINKLQWVI